MEFNVDVLLLIYSFFLILFVSSLFLFSYESYPLWNNFVSINESLESYYFVLSPGLPCISLLDFFGSVLACISYRQRATFPRSSLESLVSCVILQFGGTTLTGIILGQVPSWVTSSTAFPALFLAWILTFFSPWDLFYKLFTDSGFLYFLFEVGRASSAGHAITSWGMDKVLLNSYHLNPIKLRDSALACIFCGTISACGGGILTDYFGTLNKTTFVPSTSLKIFSLSTPRNCSTLFQSFTLAVLYYCILNPSGYLPWNLNLSRESGHLVIGVLQVVHVLFGSISPELDIYANTVTALTITVDPTLHALNGTTTTTVDADVPPPDLGTTSDAEESKRAVRRRRKAKE